MGRGGWASGPPSLPRGGVGAAPVCVSQRRGCICSRRLELILSGPGVRLDTETEAKTAISFHAKRGTGVFLLHLSWNRFRHGGCLTRAGLFVTQPLGLEQWPK